MNDTVPTETTGETSGETPAPAADAPFVLRADRNGVATLTLNRPGELNALSEGMLAALQDALDGIAADRTVRVVVLAGAGRAFCAGHNLKQMRANYTLDYQNALFETCTRIMLTVRSEERREGKGRVSTCR